MIRTIEEMNFDDGIKSIPSLTDTLAYCIVAGDFLRAKRRRFPLGTFIRELSDTSLYPIEYFIFKDKIYIAERLVPYAYSNNSQIYYLFSMEKEYIE